MSTHPGFGIMHGNPHHGLDGSLGQASGFASFPLTESSLAEALLAYNNSHGIENQHTVGSSLTASRQNSNPPSLSHGSSPSGVSQNSSLKSTPQRVAAYRSCSLSSSCCSSGSSDAEYKDLTTPMNANANSGDPFFVLQQLTQPTQPNHTPGPIHSNYFAPQFDTRPNFRHGLSNSNTGAPSLFGNSPGFPPSNIANSTSFSQQIPCINFPNPDPQPTSIHNPFQYSQVDRSFLQAPQRHRRRRHRKEDDCSFDTVGTKRHNAQDIIPWECVMCHCIEEDYPDRCQMCDYERGEEEIFYDEGAGVLAPAHHYPFGASSTVQQSYSIIAQAEQDDEVSTSTRTKGNPNSYSRGDIGSTQRDPDAMDIDTNDEEDETMSDEEEEDGMFDDDDEDDNTADNHEMVQRAEALRGVRKQHVMERGDTMAPRQDVVYNDAANEVYPGVVFPSIE